MKKKLSMWVISLLLVTLTACGGNEIPTSKETQAETQITETVQESVQETSSSNPVKTETVAPEMKADETAGIFDGYTLIEVDGGNQSGYREPNVVVDIGFGDREYWAYTNEYGQLVKVTAKEIILQDDATEPVNSDGRYYDDEAKVPGVESKGLDEGHVIADSLGGVSNAYNITPQNSTLNRHGDQAYMEKVIRDAGGCTDFTAIITYPDTSTQIPSHYVEVIGNVFDNPELFEVKNNVIHKHIETDTNVGCKANEDKKCPESRKVVKQGIYEVGDKVKIIDQWVDGCCQNIDGEMDKWLGKTLTVRNIFSTGHYLMVEDAKECNGFGWDWNDNCIEGKVIE